VFSNVIGGSCEVVVFYVATMEIYAGSREHLPIHYCWPFQFVELTDNQAGELLIESNLSNFY
jgi:hypothetical protein